MEDAVIGIDLGTTGCRAMLIDQDLNIIAQDYKEYPIEYISECEIVQDPILWWNLVCEVIRSVLKESGIKREAIKGISISSQGISFLPVDSKGQELYKAISWLDTRPKNEVDDIFKKFDEDEIFNITGKRIDKAYVLPKLLWMRKNEPGVYGKIHKILMAHDYIIMKLTGQFVTDHTMACGTLMYDIKKNEWSGKILEAFDIDKKILPAIIRSGSPAGKLKPEVAKDLGLNDEVIVAAGGQDQKCAALGGCIRQGIATVSLGTATAIIAHSHIPVLDSKKRLPTHAELFEGSWGVEGVISTSCASLKWLRSTFFSEKSYAQLDEMVEGCRDTNVFFYPYLAGSSSPWWDSDAKGSFYGISLSTTPAQIIRAVYEGIAFEIRANLDIIESLTGPVKRIRIVGGGSRGDVWCQIISNVTGKPVDTLYTLETAVVGAGILAGLGSGVYSSMEDVPFNELLKNTFSPDMEQKKLYSKKYDRYVMQREKMFKE